MIRLKILLLTFAIASSTIFFSASAIKIYDLDGLSAEVQLLLKESNVPVDEAKPVTVFFSVSEDLTIQAVSVAAQNETVAHVLEKRLINKKLDGDNWREGMIYELSVEPPKSTFICSKF